MYDNYDDLISVIIPFYNEEEYFDYCLKSVLDQDYKNIEIIIINDGSDEKFNHKLNFYKNLYPNKIKVLHNKKNRGVSYSRNLGIKVANGNYIAFLDSDDEWYPNKIKYQLNIMKKKNISFLHGSYNVVNEDNKLIGIFKAQNENYKSLINSCDIGLSTVMMSSHLCKSYKFENISTKEDYVTWLKISKKLEVLSGDCKVVSLYRKKKLSLSTNFFLKFINAYKVYSHFEKKNFLVSFLLVIKLSFYWLYKQKKILDLNTNNLRVNYLKKIENITFDQTFILVALNMASLAYIKYFYLNLSKMIFWLDGYSCRFVIDNFIKIPGRDVLKKINSTNNLSNIYLCGNDSEKQKKYIKEIFKKDVKFKSVPIFKSYKEINLYSVNFEENSLIIINIATPKQEMLAQAILNRNKKKRLFIFCLGGGVAMACGEEKAVPNLIYKMNLEWLWRLRTNTIFRLKRLIFTLLSFLMKKITFFYKNFIFYEKLK